MKAKLKKILTRLFEKHINAPIKKHISAETNRAIKKHQNQIRSESFVLFRQICAYQALMKHLQAPSETLLPSLRGYAASPDIALKLCELLEKHKPKNILELGGGFSSIIFANYTKKHPKSHFSSVDDSMDFLSKNKETLQKWQLLEHAKLIYCQQKKYNNEKNQPYFYYDIDYIPKAKSKFDFIFIDGPKAGAKNPEARYPALPLLKDKISDKAIIVIDDYNRPGERQIVKNWQAENLAKIVEENDEFDKGYALLQFTRT